MLHAQIQRGDRPLKNHKNIGFLTNSGPYPLKITKLPSLKPAFNVGPSSARQLGLSYNQWHARETPYQWRFTGGPNDGPLIVEFGSSLPLSIKKKQQKKTMSDKTFWIRRYAYQKIVWILISVLLNVGSVIKDKEVKAYTYLGLTFQLTVYLIVSD